MKKRIIPATQKETDPGNEEWLDLEALTEVELTSEDADHPIESALLPDGAPGWRAGTQGEQAIRILFPVPRRLRRIWLEFHETEVDRTQEFVLRWSADGGGSWREIIRQQWNFSAPGATCETEDHRVDLPGVTNLELHIIPDMGCGVAYASLARLRLA